MDLGGPKMPALVLTFVEVDLLENLRELILGTISLFIRPLHIPEIDLVVL